MILWDNSAGHCFVLTNLFPTGVFKVMTLRMKTLITSKTFGKFCLKAIRNTLFSNMWMCSEEGRGTQLFGAA